MDLATSSITLRHPRPQDAPAIAEAVRDSWPELEPFMVWAKADYGIDDALAWIRGDFDPPDASFVITDANDRILGAITNRPTSTIDRMSEIGYWVRTDATGNGVASEATNLILQWGFEQRDYHRTEIFMSVKNIASRRVAERVGARQDGTLRSRLLLRDGFHDAYLYSVLATDA